MAPWTFRTLLSSRRRRSSASTWRRASFTCSLPQGARSALSPVPHNAGITCAPAGFDVRRREEILMAWREKWARYLEQRTSRMTRGVVTSSIGSFAAAPAG